MEKGELGGVDPCGEGRTRRSGSINSNGTHN